jgi:hypothetical protein
MNIQFRTIKSGQICVNPKIIVWPSDPALALIQSNFPGGRNCCCAKTISGAIINFMRPRISYWLPRLLIIGFAASMVIPAPQFVTSMDDAELVVWLLRLIWVLAFPTGYLVILVLINLRKKRKNDQMP